MAKQVEQWHLEDERGQPFCMPVNQQFEEAFSAADLFVLMQPVDDREEGHTLMTAMIKHRVACILLNHGFRLLEPVEKLSKLAEDFRRMKNDLERWAWPKTTDTSHLSKPKEHQNQTAYHPNEATEASAIWSSFVKNINHNPDENGIRCNAPAKKRLSVFLSIEASSQSPNAAAILPIIRRIDSTPVHAPLSHSEATWRELLIGNGDEDGPWKKAIEWKRAMDSQDPNSKRITAVRSSPVTIRSYSC